MDGNEYKLLSSDLLALIEKVIGNKTNSVSAACNNASNNDNVIKDFDALNKDFYPESYCEYMVKSSDDKKEKTLCKKCRENGMCSWKYYCVLILVVLVGIVPASFVFYLVESKTKNGDVPWLFLFGIFFIVMVFMFSVVYSFVRLAKKDIESKELLELRRTDFKHKMEQDAFHLKNMKLELYRQEQEQILTIRQKERMAGIEERQREMDMHQKSSQKSYEWLEKYIGHLESVMKKERNNKQNIQNR